MCGIFGIVNNTEKEFDKRLFCTLGIHNDTRGGDSCGIVIDGKAEYGIDKTKFFLDFMFESKMIKNTKRCTYAVGHDRKTSVGQTCLENAQPVIFKDKKGKIVFTVLHNGTIYNYLDLADKYIPEIDCSKMTDSQVMATIFFNKGYDCLEEYHGGAVFFIVDERGSKPRYFAFKGASKKDDYKYYYLQTNSSGTIVEERPFFYVKTVSGIVFSSIPTFLKLVNKEYWTINPNKLIEFVGNKSYIVKEFDRKDCFQSQTGFYNGRKSSNNHVVYNSYYADYWNLYTGNLPFGNDNNSTKNRNESLKSTNNNPECIDTDDHDNCDIHYDDKLDLYFSHGKVCHGEYSVNKYGFGNKLTHRQGYKHYFFSGVHLYNKKCFDFLAKMQHEYKMTPLGLLKAYPCLIHFLGGEPFKLNHKDGDLYHSCDNYYTHRLYSGEITRIFWIKKLIVSDGSVVEIKNSTYANNYDSFASKKMNIDFEVLKKVYNIK